MCWYHVVQKWKEVEPVIHTESTGSISGQVNGIDFTAGIWTLTDTTLFSLTGEEADGLVETTGSEAILEPVGITSDIKVLNRDNIEFYIPYQTTPIYISCTLSGGFSVDSCTLASEVLTTTATATGYDWYKTVQYESASGAANNIYTADTAITTHYDVVDCGALSPCTEGNWEIHEEYTSYQELRSAWNETTVVLSLYGIDEAGCTDVDSGNGNGQISESVYCLLHDCDITLGGCADRGVQQGATRAMSGSISGMYGSTQDVIMPCQNVVMLDSTRDFIDSVTLARSVQGPDSELIDLSNMGAAFAEWGRSTPLTRPAPAVQQYMTTSYPQGYTVEDPANWLPLEYFPAEVPALEFVSGTTDYWRKTSTHNLDSTTNNDLCVVKECPDTFTASELISVSILDDRWSEGSQGIVISVKSNAVGESAIYHNEVDKTDAIITALQRDGILGAGEYLFDIGLI